jgi:predicted Zn-dependent protease
VSVLYGLQYLTLAGYDPVAAVSLQQTFLRLSEGRAEHGWLGGLFASHPPSSVRVARNRATAAGLTGGGDLGTERYQSAIRRLLDTRPAYEMYDEARLALSENRTDDAERLATEAARTVPAEGHFHALLGDIDASRGRDRDAVSHYRDAMARNDRFFYYGLRRGQAHQRLMEWDAARGDFEASIALLPTADAHYGLGSLAERRGDRTAAAEHYRAAANSGTTAGQAAADALARLELPSAPDRYLTLRTGLDSSGRLQVEVGNPTRLGVDGLVLAIRYADSEGAIQTRRASVEGELAAGTSRTLATGLGPFSSSQSYEVTIEAARVVTE